MWGEISQQKKFDETPERKLYFTSHGINRVGWSYLHAGVWASRRINSRLFFCRLGLVHNIIIFFEFY
jgi:hypothetical protein